MGQLHSLNWERGLDSLGEINLLSYHTFLLQRHLLFNRDCPAIQCPTMQARCRSQARPIREESTTWGILKPASSHLVIRMICHKFLYTTTLFAILNYNAIAATPVSSAVTTPAQSVTPPTITDGAAPGNCTGPLEFVPPDAVGLAGGNDVVALADKFCTRM